MKIPILIIIKFGVLIIYLILVLIYIIYFTEKFKPKIDYNNSLTNLACSIEKYFDIFPKHKTLPYIDTILDEKKPENVILLVVDGLGSKIIDKILSKNDFLVKNRKKEIFSVFPPTTAACLTSIKTGLNPSEHGWLGWTSFVKPINKIITLYKNSEKGKTEIDQSFMDIKNKYYNNKSLVELINDAGKYLAYEISCYPYNVERDIDNLFNKILEKTKIKGKKYIFAYYPEPDEILHVLGDKSQEAKIEIEKINKKVEEYSKFILENKNSVMIIVSDHGHLIADKIDIKDKDIMKYLDVKKITIENRAPGFIVKKGEEEAFKNDFNKEFGKDFYLLSKNEVLEKKIFGEYGINDKHELLETSFGDFMAFPKEKSNKCLIGEGDYNIYSFHGGYSDDEIYIPLIVLSN